MKRTDEQKALIRERLTPPPVPSWCRHLWSCCISLLAGPSSAGGFGGLQVTWVDLDAWARRMNKRLTPWQCETILMMTQAYLRACTPVDVPDPQPA